MYSAALSSVGSAWFGVGAGVAYSPLLKAATQCTVADRQTASGQALAIHYSEDQQVPLHRPSMPARSPALDLLPARAASRPTRAHLRCARTRPP